MEPFLSDLIATLVLSLRLAPAFAFAPPFTYVRAPAIVRVALSLCLAAWIVGPSPQSAALIDLSLGNLVTTAFVELFLGVALALSLQIAFAALLTVGRTLDFQVGFGLAVLADPTLRTQMPLIGTLFAYAAAAVFFATGGPADMLAIWRASVEQIPIGAFAGQLDLVRLSAYIGASFALALGIAGGVILVVFLTDLAIAFLSRTLPQMNALLLGFQVKSIVLLVTLPIAIAFSGALFLRLVRLATSSNLGLL